MIYFSNLLGAPVEFENLILFDGPHTRPFMTWLPDKKCQTNNFGKNRAVGYISLQSFLLQFFLSIFEMNLRKNMF